jgi:hypothetical protein
MARDNGVLDGPSEVWAFVQAEGVLPGKTLKNTL